MTARTRNHIAIFSDGTRSFGHSTMKICRACPLPGNPAKDVPVALEMTPSIPTASPLRRFFPNLDWRGGLILTLVTAAALVMACVPRFAQSQAFHGFADQRTMLGVPNFMDVVSNVFFALVAAVGGFAIVWRLRKTQTILPVSVPRLRTIDVICLGVFFVGVAFTAAGSTFYHLHPDNHRLVWDRLPMVLTMVMLLCALIAERVSAKSAAWMLGPFAAIAGVSVWYWRMTELAGAGDIRWYFLSEGAALASILLLVCLYPARYLNTRWLVAGLGWHALALVMEQLDRPVWGLWTAMGLEGISGHTIKHAAAACGPLMVAIALFVSPCHALRRV